MDKNLLLTNVTFNQIRFQCTFYNDPMEYLLLCVIHIRNTQLHGNALKPNKKKIKKKVTHTEIPMLIKR